MKLTVEISDYTKNGKLQHWVSSRIVPTDSREGISTHDKQGQTERLARLIDLSKVVESAVESFYQNDKTSSASLSSSKDNLVRIV